MDHNYRRCPKRPGATVTADVPLAVAEVVLRDVLRPIIVACMHAPNIVEAVALSAYLQGALDGARPEVLAAKAEIEQEEWGCPSPSRVLSRGAVRHQARVRAQARRTGRGS
jgi:hypothetical protein